MAYIDKFDILRKEFPKILKNCAGIVTDACIKAGVSRAWYYKLYNEDSIFRQRCDEADEEAIDFAESKLFNKIKNDELSAITFFLTHKMKYKRYKGNNNNGYNNEIRNVIDITDEEIMGRYLEAYYHKRRAKELMNQNNELVLEQSKEVQQIDNQIAVEKEEANKEEAHRL
jgi:hypothetical protein